MESEKTYNTEQNPANTAIGPGSTTSKDIFDKSAYDQAKHAMSQAYDRTSTAVTNTYHQAKFFSRHNPGMVSLIAFGIGVGVGVMMAGPSRKSWIRRYGDPVWHAMTGSARRIARTF